VRTAGAAVVLALPGRATSVISGFTTTLAPRLHRHQDRPGIVEVFHQSSMAVTTAVVRSRYIRRIRCVQKVVMRPCNSRFAHPPHRSTRDINESGIVTHL